MIVFFVCFELNVHLFCVLDQPKSVNNITTSTRISGIGTVCNESLGCILGCTRDPVEIPFVDPKKPTTFESIIKEKIPSEFQETKKCIFQFCTSLRNVGGSNKEEMMSKLEVKH